jgi:hypothetical protein
MELKGDLPSLLAQLIEKIQQKLAFINQLKNEMSNSEPNDNITKADILLLLKELDKKDQEINSLRSTSASAK